MALTPCPPLEFRICPRHPFFNPCHPSHPRFNFHDAKGDVQKVTRVIRQLPDYNGWWWGVRSTDSNRSHLLLFLSVMGQFPNASLRSQRLSDKNKETTPHSSSQGARFLRPVANPGRGRSLGEFALEQFACARGVRRPRIRP
jgi:hypothetical protein